MTETRQRDSDRCDPVVFDAIVVGGGPAGATAAETLARRGRSVLLLDRGGRIKPCGGAIPPRLIRDFAIPDALLVARATSARMIAPSLRRVDIPIVGGFVGMVDREHFDEWLRQRAVAAGATRRTATFVSYERGGDGLARVRCRSDDPADPGERFYTARTVVGADGARSAVALQCIAGADRIRHVFAYHEIIRTPARASTADTGSCCEVHYRGELSPDFYGWMFPHGDTISVGAGSADKGFSLRTAVGRLRGDCGLTDAVTVRREGAPIPLTPLRRWDNGRDVVLAGDSAGVVAPASGEGIYYAMEGGRLAAEAIDELLVTGKASALKSARRRFMRSHGMVFRILGIMQWFWYANDRRRERFVAICRDPDVQQLTFEAYMNKQLVRRKPIAHLRIFCKDMAHLLGIART